MPAAEVSANFCRALPKAELHAHLHGCIRSGTLLKLLAQAGGEPPSWERAKLLLSSPSRNLSECFSIFSLIHGAVRDTAAVTRISQECVVDFAADGVLYLELRTTPRAVSGCCEPACSHGDDRMECYLRAVFAGIAAGILAAGGAIVVRLLLSLNRTSPLTTNQQIISFAQRFRSIPAPDGGPPLVVGIDLSGDPTRASIAPLLAALAQARGSSTDGGGLKVSVHCAEVMNVRETEEVLDFGPDRLGHMCVLAPATLRRLLARTPRIPIEFCPTSNSLTLHLPTLGHHPTLERLLEEGYPFVICSDDTGVFNISLSGEYLGVARESGLSRRSLCDLALAGFKHVFADEATALALQDLALARADAAMLLPS